MKKFNVVAVALFAAALVAGGAFVTGGAVNAQTASPTPVTCSVGATSVAVGTPVTLTASGGTGTYVWSGPGLTITNPTGSRFTVTFNAAGTYPVTVTSGAGLTATCNVIVTAVEAAGPGGTPIPVPAAPGLPNTGELA